jgi:hypothetical protein
MGIKRFIKYDPTEGGYIAWLDEDGHTIANYWLHESPIISGVVEQRYNPREPIHYSDVNDWVKDLSFDACQAELNRLFAAVALSSVLKLDTENLTEFGDLIEAELKRRNGLSKAGPELCDDCGEYHVPSANCE